MSWSQDTRWVETTRKCPHTYQRDSGKGSGYILQVGIIWQLAHSILSITIGRGEDSRIIPIMVSEGGPETADTDGREPVQNAEGTVVTDAASRSETHPPSITSGYTDCPTDDSIRTAREPRPALSVVIVTYNEEDNVEWCIESVFRACRSVESFEVLLVDSNSTDSTVQRASEYPITVLRIPDDELTTPGAGRHVGERHARGEYILFVDGDMRVNEPWVREALSYLEDDVVAVDGHLDDPAEDGAIRPVEAVRGVALYDATPLRAVGGFDPWLRAWEDIELGLRLVTDGYRLLRLPTVAATHVDENGWKEPFRRWRSGYYLGFGQVLRKSMTRPQILARFLGRTKFTFGLGCWLVIGAFSLLVPVAFVGWIAFSALAFLVLISQLGLEYAVKFTLAKFLGVLGLVVALPSRVNSIDSFPLEAIEHLQAGPIHEIVTS